MKKALLSIIFGLICICAFAIEQEPYAFSFKDYGDKYDPITITVRDKYDEVFENVIYSRFAHDQIDLQMDYVNLEEGTHSGGDNNGRLDLPIRGINIQTREQGKWLGKSYIKDISQVKLKRDNMTLKHLDFGVYNLTFKLDTKKPGNLFYFGETPKGKIIPENNILPYVLGKITLEFYNELGKSYCDPITIDYNSDNLKTINLPKIKGYCQVKWTAVIDYSQYTVTDKITPSIFPEELAPIAIEMPDFPTPAPKNLKNKIVTKTGSFYYGVIPDNSKVAMGYDSQFGINTHFNYGVGEWLAPICKRLGFSWIRDQETNIYGNAPAIAKKYGFNLLMSFSYLQHPSLQALKKEFDEGKSTPDNFDATPYFGEYVKCVEKWKDQVDLYDLCNEPDCNGFLTFGGDWLSGPWTKVYVRWATQLAETIKKHDPTSKVLFEDLHLKSITEFIGHGAGNQFDYVSPHPYNHHRSNPLPENHGIFERYANMRVLEKEKGINWKIIEGELGFSTFKLPTNGWTYCPETEDMQAALMARTYTLHLTEPDVEKVFWFKLEDSYINPNDCEANFGIIRTDGQPKPCACAFANYINLFEGAKFTGRVKDCYEIKNIVIPPKVDLTKELGYEEYHAKDESENNTPRFYGFTDRKGVKGMICWIPLGACNVDINVPRETVRVVDLYGNTKTVKATNGKANLDLSVYPIYVFFK